VIVRTFDRLVSLAPVDPFAKGLENRFPWRGPVNLRGATCAGASMQMPE